MRSLFTLLLAQDLGAAQDLGPTRLHWAWLADTVWIVPPADLPAMQMDPKDDAVRWIVDQTVWAFQGYRTGYLWGRGVVLLREPDPERPGPAEPDTALCLTILGTVTPDGAVHLTFLPSAARRASQATTGTGRIALQDVPGDGQRAPEPMFEMQMSTGNRTRTAHWAHMVQVRPGDPAWTALPGFAMGVEEALEGCEALSGPGE